MPRVRTTIASLAAGTLLLGAAAPAAAQSTTTTIGAGQAGTAAITLSLAGTDVLTIAESLAAAVPGEAAASATPLAIAGQGVGDLAVESDGATVADDGCVTPEVPAPLDTLLNGGLACAEVSASGDDQAASAVSSVAEVGVLNLAGGDLGPLNELLDTLPLDDILGALEDQVLSQLSGGDDLFGDVRAQCVDALAPLNVANLLDPVLAPIAAASPEAIGGLLDTASGLLGGLLPTACDVLGDLAAVLTADGLIGSISEGDLLAALGDAGGVIDLTLLETGSLVGLEDGTMFAEAGPGDGAIELSLSVPLLDDVLGALLADAIAPLLSQLQTALAPLTDLTDQIPVVGELVGGLLTSGDLAAVLDGPLLSLAVAPGVASAEGDLDDGTTTGDSQPALVGLGGALFSLPVLAGLDDALNDVAGLLDSELLSVLRDSPLDDVLSVSLVDGDVVDDEVFGLDGTTATSGTASVALLGALGDPLLALDVAPATASVGVGALVAEDDDDPIQVAGPDAGPLPVTGAGAALFGLLALGAAGALRRRD